MFNANDKIFGPHAQALGLWSRRNEILAANIANADTPNYKARDVDFAGVLAAQGGTRLRMTTTAAGHLQHGGAASTDGELKYRVPRQPSLDGNSVEADVEHAEFTQNALRYQASLRFLTGRVHSMRAAISGAHQ